MVKDYVTSAILKPRDWPYYNAHGEGSVNWRPPNICVRTKRPVCTQYFIEITKNVQK